MRGNGSRAVSPFSGIEFRPQRTPPSSIVGQRLSIEIIRSREAPPREPARHPQRPRVTGRVSVESSADDRVPLVLRLLLDHRRQPREIRDRDRGSIEALHPGCTKRRARACVAQQRTHPLGPVAKPAHPQHQHPREHRTADRGPTQRGRRSDQQQENPAAAHPEATIGERSGGSLQMGAVGSVLELDIRRARVGESERHARASSRSRIGDDDMLMVLASRMERRARFTPAQAAPTAWVPRRSTRDGSWHREGAGDCTVVLRQEQARGIDLPWALAARLSRSGQGPAPHLVLARRRTRGDPGSRWALGGCRRGS